MGIIVKIRRYLAYLTLGSTLTACAMTSGLQTSDLHHDGLFQTDLGTEVNVIKITQDSILNLKPSEANLQTEYAHLFNIKHRTYILNSGDILSIYLWAYPEITPPTNIISTDQAAQAYGYQIDQDGYIYFPMIGRYKAAGKSLTEVNYDLQQKLAHYLKIPDVVVRVLSYQGKRFSVQGNVQKSGQYALTDQPISLYTALGMAGGVSNQYGANTSIHLIRDQHVYKLNSIQLENAGFSLHQLLIQPDDTIYVNSKDDQKVYVMGEAGRNQALPLRDHGMSLSDVIGESLGLNSLSANRSKIYVVRNNQMKNITEVYHLDLSSIADFGLANKFAVQSNDIVYVDVAGLARWQRVINQMLPFSNIIYNVDRLGQ
jgi:polysaccharide biosynthesis/export protein